MSREEREQLSEEFEVELVDLDPAGVGHFGRAGSAPRDEHAANVRSRHVSLQSRLSPWQRHLRLLFTCVLVVVTLVAFGSFLSRDNGLPSSPATPSPFVLAGANLFYVDASPPWGKLYVDGRFVAHPPLSSSVPPLQLASGQHRFEWRAAPFEPIRCTISVPAQDTDACPHTVANIPSEPEAQMVLLYGTLNLLPQPQRLALTLAAQQPLDALSSSDIVQPGEHFLETQAKQGVAVARQPLRATLRFHLDTVDTINATISSCKVLVGSCTWQFQDLSQDCLLLCTSPPDSLLSAPFQAWQAIVVMHATWDYRTLDGQAVALDQPDALPSYTQFAHFFSLLIAWNGVNWSATVDSSGMNRDSATCFTAMNTFDAIAATLGPPAATNLNISQSDIAGQWPAIGCLELITRLPPSSPTPFLYPTITPTNTAFCLYRFGFFLAANGLAHRYWPLMLVANAYERELAVRLALL